MSGEDGDEGENFKIRAITPGQYIFEEIPRKYPAAEEPELIPLFGKIRWTGHTHTSDLDALANALSHVYKFERIEPTIDVGDLWGIEQVLVCRLEAAEARFEGVHAIGELTFDTGLIDLNAVQNWERIIRMFREERRDAKATFFYAKYPNWHVGYCTEHKRFFESKYGTIYFEQRGNRDVYKISIRIPPTVWIWDMYPVDMSQRVHRALAEAQKFFKHTTHVYDVYESDIFGKRDLFATTVEIERMDIDFEDYEGPKSVFDYAEKFSEFLTERKLEVGGTEEAFFILMKRLSVFIE